MHAGRQMLHILRQPSIWWRRLLALYFICVCNAPLCAADLVAIPPLNRAVTDLTSTLSASEQTALEQRLTAFAKQQGAQLAVLILPSTYPEDIAQFGIRLAEHWQLGRAKQDDGVILIVAKDDRKLRIEVGYGLEGAIPDALAKRIISEQLTPAFKQGHYAAGINAACDQLMALIAGEHLPAPSQRQPAAGLSHWVTLMMLTTFVVSWLARACLGTFLGSVATGGVLGGIAAVLGASGMVIVGVVIATIFLSLAMATGVVGMPTGFSGGGRQGDVFRGGGGGFGGGGASGDW